MVAPFGAPPQCILMTYPFDADELFGDDYLHFYESLLGDDRSDGDTDAAIDFLRHLFGDRVRSVLTIRPDDTGKTVRHDFPPNNDDALRDFIDRAQGAQNVYYMPHDTEPGGKTTPGKGEIKAARLLHLDADLKDMGGDDKAVLAKIRALEPPPTFIVFSGGGYQAGWVLVV